MKGSSLKKHFSGVEVLVTGGAGFIGSHLTDSLLELGAKVKVIDSFITGKEENLAQVRDQIELIRGDIRDLPLLEKITKGVKYIFHQAAFRSVPKSVNDPLAYNEANVGGTLNLLWAAHKNKVKRVIFASSSSVYGDIKELPQKESFLPQLISPYAATKLAGEYYCRVFNEIYKLETVSLRYFNVFGPRQSLESQYAVVIPKFITCLLNNEAPPIHGDGLQSRDFTYVSNVVEANLLAMVREKAKGQVFNVACGKAYNLLELVEKLNRIMDKNIKPKFTPLRLGDVRHTLADISKAKKLLGFAPEINFEEGLKRCVEVCNQV